MTNSGHTHSPTIISIIYLQISMSTYYSCSNMKEEGEEKRGNAPLKIACKHLLNAN